MKIRYVLACLAGVLLALAPSCLASHRDKALIRTSVTIKNMAETSGGSGVIIRSGRKGSLILTNKHVCKLIDQDGGIVEDIDHVKHVPFDIKEDTNHDLCTLRIAENMHINLRIARDEPELGDEAIIVGHPSLLPVLITKGSFSETILIKIADGMRECTEAEKVDPMTSLGCMLQGGMQIVITREARVVSATIMPGSSGSPVFNSRGELSGLVFAGSQGLSYGMIVPLGYIRRFLN